MIDRSFTSSAVLYERKDVKHEVKKDVMDEERKDVKFDEKSR